MDEILQESSYAQYLLQRGRAEGREEGREEGQREMAGRMAQLALEGRFGTLSEDLLAAVRMADEAVLREIVAHIGTDSLQQVRQRLGMS
jgi:predicted transposase YdaD